MGHVCDICTDGRMTVRYGDGLLWPVEADKLRVVAGSASCVAHRNSFLTKQADTPVLSRQDSFDGADWSVVTSLTGSTCASERDRPMRRPFTFGGSSQIADGKVGRHDENPAPATGKVPPEWSARLSYNDWSSDNSGLDLRHARDDLLACELESLQRQAELAASAAEVSGDWWHIQAAIQLVTSAGVGSRWTPRLLQAARKLELPNAGDQVLDSVLLSSAVAKYLRHRDACRERRRAAAAKGWPHVLSAGSSIAACGPAWEEESCESEASECLGTVALECPGIVRQVRIPRRGRRVCCL